VVGVDLQTVQSLAPAPKTGQTESCGVRVDGALQEGVAWPIPRFVPLVNKQQDYRGRGGRRRNGVCDGTEECNGTVLDRLTGLIWLGFSDSWTYWVGRSGSRTGCCMPIA